MKLPLLQRLYKSIAKHTAARIGSDLQLALQITARDESAKYVATRMVRAQRHHDRKSLLLSAVAKAEQMAGCICEFGVASGESLRLLANSAPTKIVHGFDSFEGLPMDWRPGYQKGFFKTNTPKFSQSNVRIHIGLFENTLPQFIASLKEPISLVHIDCDLYSSTRYVLKLLAPLLKPGAILLFDEYFNYPGWQDHEHRALLETLESQELSCDYVGYNSIGEQVMVEVLNSTSAD